MHRAALLFSNPDYGTQLARAVESVGASPSGEPYAVDVISHVPIRERVSRVISGDYDLLVADEPIGNGPFAATLARLTRTPLALVFRGWADLTNDHGEWSRVCDRLIAVTNTSSREACSCSRRRTLGLPPVQAGAVRRRYLQR